MRLFLCRLIDLSITVRKLHHHISLNALARSDVISWESFLPSRNVLQRPILEITYSCSLLLPPRRTLNQYQLHTTWPRSELTSPTPTGQSCSPIYENYSIGIRRYQGFFQSFQAPRRRSLSLLPTLACLCIPRPSGVCGRVSVLHHSLGYRSPCTPC